MGKSKVRNKFNGAKWDPLTSTFSQIIYFKNGNEITGYSRKIGFTEKKGEVECLCNFILRMYRYGYLNQDNHDKNRIDYVEYYHLAVNRRNPPKIIRMYYTFPEFGHGYLNWSNEFVKWIDKFYEMIAAKKTMQEIWDALYFAKSKKEDYIDALALDPPRFRNATHLANYCAWLIENTKRPKGEVEHFYRKYMEKYFK